MLLAKDNRGYQNLCKLSSLAHLDGFYYTPRIDRELLENYHEGLICLSGPLDGLFSQLVIQGKEGELRQEIGWFKQLFGGDFYFEVQRHRMSEQDIRADGLDRESWLYQYHLDSIRDQEKVIEELKKLSQELAVRCVATNDIHYLEREDWKAHEILMNVQSGEPCEIWEKDSQGNLKQRVPNPKRRVAFSHELCFKSPSEMEALFADMPDAIAATEDIAAQCSVELDLKTRYYPVFIPPHLEGKEVSKEERSREAENFLRQLCQEGIVKRYTPERLSCVQEKYPGRDPMEVVRERLDYELEIITSKGMCDYLLIVYDFIDWAKRQRIPMGPGRGSGAGSIILYLIGITDIEPLRFNLFFERFINPERISYPDIDVDICMDRRSEVIEYTLRKYGKDKVAQIITFGTMKAKMAIKDVGRVLSVPLARVNEIAKLVPEDPTMTLDKAFELDPELRKLHENDPEARELLDIAKKLEGSVRNTGIHAAGLIISGEPLLERIPLCSAKDSDMLVTQFSMKPVEAVGMLKIDFLGLKTLTSIQHAFNAINEREGKQIDWINLPLNDQATFNLLNQGKTQGIFQLESGGMQELAKQLHIDKFEEIIAVGALYRPGPMEMIPSFINRKHKREAIEIDHPLMEKILSETYGIMVYQEQVMQIASLLANYTLGEGDVLRRAMGKKDKEEMARQREKFRTGALQKGINEETSMKIFDKVEKFASYGFNKSHAAAYGYLSYVTAYLKANYPADWMAALLTSDRDDVSKVAKLIRECQAMDIAILPPDLNESGREFVATTAGIRFAMNGIKGVGEGVVEAILAERKAKGPFKSLYDLLKRIDTKKVGKKAIENLIESGCFDFTKWQRQAMLETLDPLFAAAAKSQRDTAKGILDLFASGAEEDPFPVPPEPKEKVSKQYLLKRENELLGFYLNGHPLDDYQPLMQRLSCRPLSKIAEAGHNALCRAAFIIETVSVKISAKSQRKFAILTIGDGLERFELPIWPDLYEEKAPLIIENQLVYAILQIENGEEGTKLQCRWLADLTRVNDTMINECDLAYDKARAFIKSSELREKRQESFKNKTREKEKETPVDKLQKISIAMDADKARLSHVLELKKLFRATPGRTSIEVLFVSGGETLGAVHIDESWGVDFHPSLPDKIKSLPSVVSVAVEKRQK